VKLKVEAPQADPKEEKRCMVAQFRNWDTSLLKDDLTKSIAMDGERLRKPENSVLFEQILARIRDIRSSEKVF